METNQKIIQRFDELICEKASKFELENVKRSLNNYCVYEEFLHSQNNIKETNSSIILDISQIKLRLDEYQDDLTQSITSSLKTVFS
jgi:hypothetical protein